MRIGIDARLLERKVTGLGRTFDRVLRVISEVDSRNNYVLFCQDGLHQYEKMGFTVLRTGRIPVLPSKFCSPLWLNAVLPRRLSESGVDIFFTPSALLPLVRIHCKTVALIPDALVRLDRMFFSSLYRAYAGPMLAHSVKRCAAIITISKCSQKDIMRFYGIPAGTITVAYLAADERFCPRELDAGEKKRIQKKYNLPERFVLYVGVIENRKNIPAIMKVADLLGEQAADTAVVLVGRPGFGFNGISREMGGRRNVRYLKYIEDEDLPFIYNLSEVFLFPSFYEGFGLPPLEAMCSGVPVVTSNTSSLPEVVGDGGIMHHPADYVGIAASVTRLLKDREFNACMRQKALVRAGEFNWLRTANDFVGVFQKLS